MITIDAAGARKKIVEKIRDLEGDDVIALKGNQGHLHDEAQNFFEQARAIQYDGCDCTVAKAIEKGHGRIEEREVVVTSLLRRNFSSSRSFTVSNFIVPSVHLKGSTILKNLISKEV